MCLYKNICSKRANNKNRKICSTQIVKQCSAAHYKSCQSKLFQYLSQPEDLVNQLLEGNQNQRQVTQRLIGVTALMLTPLRTDPAITQVHSSAQSLFSPTQNKVCLPSLFLFIQGTSVRIVFFHPGVMVFSKLKLEISVRELICKMDIGIQRSSKKRN